MAADYCTTQELAAQLGIDDTDDDDLLQGSVTAASREIEGFCGRRFWIDDTVTNRVFYATDRDELDLFDQPGEGIGVDIATATGLIIAFDTDYSGTYETALTAYNLLPANAIADGRGFSCVRIGYGSAYTFPVSHGYPTVQITAKFGFPSVPEDVKKACLIQAAQLYKAKDAVFGAVSFGDSGAMYMRSGLASAAKALLAPYQRALVG